MIRHPGVTGALALVAVTLAILQVLPGERALDFLTVVLAAASAVYLGAALAGNDKSTLALETTAGIAFIALALVGRWYAITMLAWAYFAHGLWDLLHHRRIAGAKAGRTFPVLCCIYDWVIAVVIVVWF